jgi:hypothetical protein
MSVVSVLFVYLAVILIHNQLMKQINERFLKLEKDRLDRNLKTKASKISLPVRLQAYERLALLMERIAPAALVLRISRPGISLFQLQLEMINSIHEEFEHNLSQQIYVSTDCWSLVRSAVEQTIQQINVTVASLDRNADAGVFAAQFLQNVLEQTNNPAEQALSIIRSEAARLF